MTRSQILLEEFVGIRGLYIGLSACADLRDKI